MISTEWMDLRSAKFLWLVLGAALLLRIWGIGYGLPFVYWTDEYHEVMRALELGAGEFNLSRTTKGGFYLLLFFEYGVYYVLLKLSGSISTAQQFAEQFVRDPTPFYMMGRSTAAMFGCATVAAVFCLGRQAYRPIAGVMAAVFLAVNVLHVELSHKVGVDVPMALFATLSLYFGLRVATDGRRRDYLLAGLCAALATTTKLPGILVILPLLIAHTYHVIGSSDGVIRWFASRDIWLAVLIFSVVLAVTNPGILLQFNYLSFYSSSPEEMLDNESPAMSALDSFSRPNLYLFYLNVLQVSMGWPLFALTLISVGYSVWKHKPADIILLSYALINYLAIASIASDVLYYPRYALPVIVVLSVLAGRAVSDMVSSLPSRRMALSIVLTAVLVAWPLTEAVRYTYSLTQTDTRTLAKEWFEANVPAGRKVLIEGSKIAAARITVPLVDSRESLEQRIAYWNVQEPRQARYLELKRVVHEGGGYDLELVRIGSIAPLNDYLARGIEYFVVRPDYFVGSRKSQGGSAAIVNALRTDTRVDLLTRFEARAGRRPGPTIEIYHVQQGFAPGG